MPANLPIFFLQRQLQRLGSIVVSSPRKFIVWPASIAFILSYPFLYALLSPTLPDARVLPSSHATAAIPKISVKQLYVSPPPFSNALSEEILDSLAPFLDVFNHETINYESDSDLPYLHSIISNTQSRFLDTSIPKDDKLDTLLFLPRVFEKEIQSASGLLISFIYETVEDAHLWDRAVASLISNSNTPQNEFSYIVASKSTLEPASPLSLPWSSLPFCPAPFTILTIMYSLLALYITLSWNHIKSVRSKLGLFIAFVVQSGLSMGTSLTIVSIFFPSFSVESLRHFLIIPYFVVIVGVENVFRLVKAVSSTPPENHPSVRMSSAIGCLQQTIKVVLRDSSILLAPCLPIFGASSQVKHICLFAALCLIIDLLMHVTYFVAILSVDLRRLELEDLITTDNAISKHQPDALFVDNLPKALRSHYLHLKHLIFHPKVSASSVIFAISLVFLMVWGKVANNAEQHNYSSGRIPFFLSSLLESAPLSKYDYIRVFEPLVIEGQLSSASDGLPIIFSIGKSFQGSFYNFFRIISINILLELLASVAFILSLTGVILKFLLPPISEPTRSTAPSSEVVEFFSKELTGYHTLDVLQVIAQGSTITTVSLDHKVFVWNAASSPGPHVAKPIQIPNPPDFWPITKVVLNSSLSLIAIFSTRIPAIKCYSYKTGGLLYHLQDRTLFSAQPVETFFSGPELIVVERSGTLLSISEAGAITTFPIEFPSKNGTLVHAKRLVTPRIPERVVCFSSQSEICIGTHIGKVWKFRKLQIQESPMQINMHTQGVHDLSKYRPQPIPAPQAMLARRPMRPGRMAGGMNAITRPPIIRPKILDNPIVALVPVPAINMVLIATSVYGCLFDAQTGIIVRHFQLGHFKPQSLRVFHSHPTHCRFCGCVSVDTLSIAYSDSEEEGMVICHTLTIDNRAKNSICIRVERDPRETRCLGFEATTERQHWIGRVEGWDTTDMNMIMGVRKKESPQDISKENPTSSSPLTTSLSWIRNRAQAKSRNSFSRDRSRNRERDTKNLKNEDFPLISSSWEGWAMSATGQVSYYDIPDYSEHVHPNESNYRNDPSSRHKHSIHHHMNIGMELDGVSRSRLLIRSIGPVTKYGAKSIAVAFGNIIKVLYFGKEESISKEAEPTLVYPPSPSPSISGSRKYRREVGY